MSWFSNLFKKQHENMLIFCATCSRDFFKTGKELGTKQFVSCPMCGGLTPVVPYSPAQEAAKHMARIALDMDRRRP
jgi:DNA-directed RNA polymerase subunit RPC12/RpoP